MEPNQNKKGSSALTIHNPEDTTEPVLSDFEKFFEEELKPYLQSLGLNRSAFLNWKYFTIASALLAIIFLLLYQFIKMKSGLVIGLLLLAITLVGIYFTTRKNDKYIDGFKDNIISRIIHYISPEAIYKPSKYLSKKEYIQSGLYRRRFTQYEGDDYWKSSYRGVNFHCSELLVRYEDSTVANTIFKGLFIEAGINNYYAGCTYVWTKGAPQLPASIADENYRMYPLPPVRKYSATIETFNHSFSVYSSNFLETEKILSFEMQEKMLLLKEKTGRNIVFSFVEGKFFAAIPMDEDLLEPTGNGLKDKETYKKHFFTFLLVFNIVRELELNKLQ